MEIKAVNSFAVTRPAAPTAQVPEPQVAAGGGQGEQPKVQAGIYISPVVRYDQAAKLAVLFFRDADTGETRDQIPAERVVEEYRRAGGRAAADGAVSGESPTGYRRVSGAGTGEAGTADAGTTTTTVGTGGPTAGGSSTGAGGGYGTTGPAPVPTGFGAPGGSTGARVSVTV